jgi:glycosyltransferase involved in cell wall biosynthesis
MGVEARCITVVQNTIDTDGLMQDAAGITVKQLEQLRDDLELDPGPVAIFCGGMYAEKRIDFLLEAANNIRKSISGFQLLLLGAGSESEKVSNFCSRHSWAKYIGPKFGAQRVPYFMLADVLMMPGLAGLVVLDSFALGVPMITTAFPFHSPEIEYIEAGVSGLVTENNMEAYCAGVEAVLRDSDLRGSMRSRCLEMARKYTLQAMVANFADGVKRALDREPLH